MASIRKVLRSAWLSRSYEAAEGKENQAYVETPHSKRTHTTKRVKSLSERPAAMQSEFKRNSNVSKSMRDALGNFRQKLKRSTRQRKRLQDSPMTPASRFRKEKSSKRTPTRKGGYREVKMYSPFQIETPRSQTKMNIRTRPKWHDIETPTRLRKEVEDLTANMQALVNLTPGTLQTRAASRRSILSPSTLTNGSLKTPKSSQKAVRTIARRNEKITEI